jgi:AcrR family transcriptional regulator
MSIVSATPVGRDSYHHGDLLRAIVTESVELARSGGPQAVVLREAARRVGVSAASAYRHLDGHGGLLAAVREEAQRELTDALLSEPLDEVPAGDRGALALARLRAQSRGYLRFAQAQPGLFRVAFGTDAGAAERSESFGVLSGILDELAASGLMTAERRPGAEIMVWASLHGLAELLVNGSLSSLDARGREAATEQMLDFITRGLTA